MGKKTYFKAEKRAMAADGQWRVITVLGCRFYEKETVWDDTMTKTGSTTDFHFVCTREKYGNLLLAYSIRHPEENTTDPEAGVKECMRRLKAKADYLHFSTTGNMRPFTCQAIVNAEAEHIASKIDSFIRKLQDVEGNVYLNRPKSK